MRIGFDAKRAFYNKTGLGNYSRDLLRALFSFFPEEEYVLFTPTKGKFYNPLEDAQVITAPLLLRGKASVLWRTFFLPASLKKAKIDIFHGLTNELPFGLKKLNIKKLVTIHDLIFLRYPEFYNSADTLIYKKKVLYACAIADKIIAVSTQTKEDLVNLLNVPEEKIHVIYQDCHECFQIPVNKEFAASIREKYHLPPQFILSVGTLEQRKNQLSILKALTELPEEFKLVLVGKDNEYKEILAGFIKKHQLQKRVLMLENVPFYDLPAMYYLAKVFAYPSIFEGFGIPILEAMNIGVPVVTSKGSCFAETAGEAAMYVSPGDFKQLAEAIKKVWDNVLLSAEMVEKGFEQAKKFRKEKNINALINIYRSL